MKTAPEQQGRSGNWRVYLALAPMFVSCWLLAARFLADGETLFSGLLLFLPLVLLLAPNPWVVWVFRVVLVAGGALWAVTAWEIRAEAPPGIVALVWGIAAFTLLSALTFETPALKRYFQRHRGR